ncbi:MAG: DUF932 domain-containing protein [Saprospiraceae bacterium]|nr:DUF932 domain-containing protein [Saprospiraceae bacterium]
MYLDRLKKDDIFVKNEVVKLESLTGIPTRKGLENAIISEGQIVNVVSNKYAHLTNENFFLEVERALIESDINYVTQSINRGNRSFAVDYILQDENFVVNVKTGADEILPMLRFTNGYDGSTAPSGRFGFFRKVCSNGLHVAETKVGFKLKHRGNIESIVIPRINEMVQMFMKNEYYDIKRKFDVLAETPIQDLSKFVQVVCNDTNIFKFEKSDKNPEPSKLAQMVIDTITNESLILNYDPNLWIGYNAFNEVLHKEMKKTFENQRQFDNRILESVMTLS